MSVNPREVYGYSDCCQAPIFNPIVYRWDGVCSECGEHCNDENEGEESDRDTQTAHWNSERM